MQSYFTKKEIESCELMLVPLWKVLYFYQHSFLQSLVSVISLVIIILGSFGNLWTFVILRNGSNQLKSFSFYLNIIIIIDFLMISIFGLGEIIPNLCKALQIEIKQFEGSNQVICKLSRRVFHYFHLSLLNFIYKLLFKYDIQ